MRRREWRRSPAGRRARQRENRRYREQHPGYPAQYRKLHLERVRAIERASKGRCRAKIPRGGDVHKGASRCRVPCRRPGCYRLFLIWAALASEKRYCGAECSRAMRRYSALLSQLRYRNTDYGNYRRKLSPSRARLPPACALESAPPH